MESGGDDCCVKVAVHIRPLIPDERAQGCKDCVTVIPGTPQALLPSFAIASLPSVVLNFVFFVFGFLDLVQIGAHSFTFDHVYGSSASPSSAIFEECISPLVDGLFQGYNATVLAYGQTGSGKTYTMGTGYRDDCQIGIIPQVMDALFDKIESFSQNVEFQLHVSFIEILKEEVLDLLDPGTLGKSDALNGTGKAAAHGKPPIQIRENSSGVITLAGSTEIGVTSKTEMAACLEQGSLSRATGSTNMNNQSSRSHAIFTITMEQIRKVDLTFSAEGQQGEETGEDYLCAKLHLVDLAGSERAKRTGSDGLRFKEGVHINRGLLALGNVISALGDEKKRKEGAHVPYRDSKLTRLLQDSLGGNSRTVMIACISPADINAEESLNTLKYANRARNIQNKPIVNRDPVSNEIQKMRQQLEYLQAELLSARAGSSSDEVQALKERISWLEANNEELCRTLNEYRSRFLPIDQSATNVQKSGCRFEKPDGFKSGVQGIDSSEYTVEPVANGTHLSFHDNPSKTFQSSIRTYSDNLVPMEIGRATITSVDNPKEMDEESTKEWEHALLQDTMDKELNELNKRLEQKQSEMKMIGGFDTESLKQHFGKKLMELEDEKRAVEQERDRLSAEVENLSASSDGHSQKLQDMHLQKLKSLEAQILDLKKKQESHVHLLKQKQRSDEAARRLQEEIQSIKAQKVQLQNKIKQEAEQFRMWKASREKELLQLRKEGRRNEYERHKLQALNQRQKMVLQRKTEEAAMATKRLKELLEARKSSTRDNAVFANASAPSVQPHHLDISFSFLKNQIDYFLQPQSNDKSLQRWLDHELEVTVNIHEVRSEYEKQSQVRAAMAEELSILKQIDDNISKGISPPKGKNGTFIRLASMAPDARSSRITTLENMLNISSNTLVAMASQLSEAEERERAFTGRGRWNQLRTMGDAKNLLQYIFNTAADARCRLRDKEIENKEMKEQINELVGLLRQSEARRKETEKHLRLREHAIATTNLSPSSLGNQQGSTKHAADDANELSSPTSSPVTKQLKYTAGIANGTVSRTVLFPRQKPKACQTCCYVATGGQLTGGRKLTMVGQGGKLWRWKRSHQQWLVQFKWKWQKPWRLSEWIRHNEIVLRARPRPQLLAKII
ncbi:Kinesin-like protein [Nymphaea thermarum]|nr:Kinesin-like protein [Nymphaea thermarum]